jgi:hypothetical protein
MLNKAIKGRDNCHKTDKQMTGSVKKSGLKIVENLKTNGVGLFMQSPIEIHPTLTITKYPQRFECCGQVNNPQKSKYHEIRTR